MKLTTAPATRREIVEDGSAWLVLVVDDEPDIHDALRLAIGRNRFFGRRLEFKNALSAKEAESVMGSLDRTRLVMAFVDVVMEHDRAGLELVGKLRAKFGSPLQVVLNTGQPHIMAAEDVARKFEISAYLSKPEATPERLKTLINVGIRNFRKFTAMQVLCDSLSNFVALFESATTTTALDQLLTSALLQYSTVWQFSYVFSQDLEATDPGAMKEDWQRLLLDQLRNLERDCGPTSFVPIQGPGGEEAQGCIVRPISGRFSAGLAFSMPDHPSEVLAHELQLLLRSWVLTRESIELKQAAAEEQRVREEIHRERRESIAQMVAGVAHEVNTPLGVANTAANTLAEIIAKDTFQKLKESKEYEEDMADVLQGLKLIQKNIARADELIRTFRKLSVGQLVDKREELDLGQCIKEVIQLWGPEAKKGQIEVKFNNNLDANCTRWIGYAGHLSQILLNLLTNSKRYAYEAAQGGRIEVTASSRIKDDKADFTIQVRDFGAGIPKENLPRIFEAFFTTGRSKGGTGLGLSIVQNLVTSVFGGTIRCESEVGKGTSFIINFSHCKESKPAEGAPTPEEEGGVNEVVALEDFLKLQQKLVHNAVLTPDEQIRLSDVKVVVESFLVRRFGGQDRRGVLRIPVRQKVAVERLGSGQQIQTDVRELSMHGAVHVCKEKLEIGEKVRIRYSSEDPELAIEGEVSSSQDLPSALGAGSSCQVGIKFAILPDELARRLKLLIAQLLLAQLGIGPQAAIG